MPRAAESRLADAVLRECGRALTEYVSAARAADDAGGGRDGCPEQVEQESRGIAQHAHTQARISLSGLEALVTSLKDIPGPEDSRGVVGRDGGRPAPDRLGKVAAEAQAARVSIYALHLEVPVFEAAQDRISPTLARDLQVKGDGLARVAGAARGAVFRLAGDDPRPFERIARELSGYYLLAFEPIESRERRTQPSHSRGARARRWRVTGTKRVHVTGRIAVQARPRLTAGDAAPDLDGGDGAARTRRHLYIHRARLAPVARGRERRS